MICSIFISAYIFFAADYYFLVGNTTASVQVSSLEISHFAKFINIALSAGSDDSYLLGYHNSSDNT